jgi:hypothetical protein
MMEQMLDRRRNRPMRHVSDSHLLPVLWTSLSKLATESTQQATGEIATIVADIVKQQ